MSLHFVVARIIFLNAGGWHNIPNLRRFSLEGSIRAWEMSCRYKIPARVAPWQLSSSKHHLHTITRWYSRTCQPFHYIIHDLPVRSRCTIEARSIDENYATVRIVRMGNNILLNWRCAEL
jgi:hypothetical protein